MYNKIKQIEIMKAIIEKGITYKVTGERGVFTITEDVKGNVKMFQSSTVEIVEIEEMPKAKVYKKGSKPSQASCKAFQTKMREAQFQELYVESQRSSKY